MINKFSITRVLRLINMELRIGSRQLLILSGVIIVGVLIFSLLTGYASISYDDGYALVTFESILMFVLFAYLLYFIFMMNVRVRNSNTIAYSAIPSSTLERFLSILLLGIIHFLIAWLVAQVIMSLLLLINPTASESILRSSSPHKMVASIGSYHYYSLKAFTVILQSSLVWLYLTVMLYTIVSSKSAFGWNASTWWEKLMLIFLIALVIVPIRYSETYPQIWNIMPNVYWVISGAFFIGSYFRLKFIEQL